MEMGFKEKVTVVKRVSSGTDRQGNSVVVDGATKDYRCPVSRNDANATSANERVDAQDIIFAGLLVFLPHGADVGPSDQVVARGQRWDVYGLPQDDVSPFTGWAPGIQVALTRSEG